MTPKQQIIPVCIALLFITIVTTRAFPPWKNDYHTYYNTIVIFGVFRECCFVHHAPLIWFETQNKL